MVARIRCSPERIDAMIQETRALIARHGVACQWFVDPHTIPANVPGRLAARGILPDPEPRVIVMTLGAQAQLPPLDPRVEIGDALSSAQLFATASAIQAEAFGTVLDHESLPESWERARTDPTGVHLLALYDGRPAGAANAIRSPDGWLLAGGATREAFRGHGVFRALVRERWQRAIAGGAPGVAVHAGRMSAPILARLGFQTVGQLDVYRDEGTAP